MRTKIINAKITLFICYIFTITEPILVKLDTEKAWNLGRFTTTNLNSKEAMSWVHHRYK